MPTPLSVRGLGRGAAVCILVLLRTGLAGEAPSPKISAKFAAGGHLREGRAALAAIRIENRGPGFDAELVVRARGKAAEWFQSLKVPPSSTRESFLPIRPGERGSFEGEAVLTERGSGRVLGAAPLRGTVGARVFVLGVVGTYSDPALRELFGFSGVKAVNALSAFRVEEFPGSWAGLEPFDALVVAGDDFAGLSPQQLEALRDWVLRGGSLFAVAKGPPRAWAGSFVAASFGLEVGTQRIESSGSALFTFAKRGTERDLRLLEKVVRLGAVCRSGRRVVFDSSGDLVVEARLGRGTVCWMAVDPSSPAPRAWAGWIYFWRGILGRRLASKRSDEPKGEALLNATIARELSQKVSTRPPLLFVLLAAVFYGLLIGPGDYFALRFLGKRLWTAWTFPATVAVCSLAALGVTSAVRGSLSEVLELTVEDVDPATGDSSWETWAGIYAPSVSEFSLRPSRPATVRELFLGEAPLAAGAEAPGRFSADGGFEGRWLEGMTRFYRLSGTVLRTSPPIGVQVRPEAGSDYAGIGTHTAVTVRNGYPCALTRCVVVTDPQLDLIDGVLVLEGEVPPGEERTFSPRRGDVQVLSFEKWFGRLRRTAGSKLVGKRPDLRDLAAYLAWYSPNPSEDVYPKDRILTLQGETRRRVFLAWLDGPPPLLEGESLRGSRHRVLHWVRVQVPEVLAKE
jgi:hypothetical protein